MNDNITYFAGNINNPNNKSNGDSPVDPSLNQDIIDIINTLTEETISRITNKYRGNKYVLGRINNYINNLPTYIENDLNNYIKRKEHLTMINQLLREFTDNYIDTNNYYYSSASEIFFKYDGLNYFTYRDDTILYEISNLVIRDHQLVNYKYRIKHMVMREIKERNIFDSIPDTGTIQLVINSMLPLFLNNKTYVKYFLTVIGDIILKKNDDFSYLIDTSFKRFIKMLSDLAYQYFGTNHFTNIKYGYHELQRKCRIIYTDKYLLGNRYNNTIDNLISNLSSKNSNNFLDVFIVGVYYSNRYENSDKFIISDECEHDIRGSILLLDDNNLIIDRFISDSIQIVTPCSTNDDRENNKITNKNMQYLWKLFLSDNNLPNINFILNLKTLLREKIDYSQEHDVYLGITSKKLPLISNFLDFWNTTIRFEDSEFIEEKEIGLEISEIISLFKYWLNIGDRNISNVAVTERSIIDLIMYYYEDVNIEDDKYVPCVSSTLWDKNASILDFFTYYKETYIISIINTEHPSKKTSININNLYTQYCKWCRETAKKFVVGKHYFQKFTNSYFNHGIKQNLLDIKQFISA